MIPSVKLSDLKRVPITPEERKRIDNLLQKAIAATRELKDKYGIETVCDVC